MCCGGIIVAQDRLVLEAGSGMIPEKYHQMYTCGIEALPDFN
jgi:hypothetical protein